MSHKNVVTIFICDDSELDLLGLKTALERIPGFKIVGSAKDGQQAVNLVLRLKPQLVLMDICMPVMSGIEATRTIKSTLPEVKIIMLTSAEDDQTITAAFSAGAHGYCSKSLVMNQLKLAVESVLQGAGWLDPCIATRVLSRLSTQPSTNTNILTANILSFNNTKISAREIEVLDLIVAGLSNSEIAGRLFITKETVKTHVKHLFEKLVVKDRTQAAVTAMRQGLVPKPCA